MYAQLDAPSSSWNTLIQSEVYGEVFDSEELFVNVEKPVFINQYDNASYRLDKLTNEGDNLGNIFEEVSYTFYDGFLGSMTRNNPRYPQSILTFSTLGISSVTISQNTDNNQFGGSGNGNGNNADYDVEVTFNFNIGSSFTLDASFSWREPSSGNIAIIGLEFKNNVNQSFTYGSSTYTIDGGTQENSTSLGLKIPGSSVSPPFSDGQNRSGANSTAGILEWLNDNISDDTAPEITSGISGTNLAENSGANQDVYTIVATDVGGVTSYAIGGTDASLLTLTGNVVSLDGDPDYETKSSYSFTVTASDAIPNTSDVTTVTFSITDVDDTAPEITSGISGTNLAENSGANQDVYTIVATDVGGVTSYAIGGTDASLLTLTGNVVSLDGDPDYETKSSYSFTVTASDAIPNTSDVTTVTFSITDVDDTAPEITSGISGTNLAENSGANQDVYTIVATDVGGVTSYAIGGTDASLLTLTGNVVSLDGDPDYETKSSYSFTVTASDAIPNTSDVTTVTFSITDVDDTAPTLIEDTVVSTPSNDTTPSVVISSNEAGTITSSLGFTSTTTGISGDNTITFNTLNAGTYTPTVTFTDASGNESTVALTSFVIDDTAPTLIEDTVVSTPSNDTTPSVVISSNEAGTITSSLGFTSTTTGISGDNTITFNTLNAGTYTPTVTFTDASGNESTVALTSFVIDDTAPTLIEDTVVSTPSNDTTPSVVISSNEAGTITSSLGFTSTTTGISGDNTITFNTLNAGTYTPTVTFTDASGNESTVALTSFVIDDTAPTLIEDTVVSTPSNDTTPSVVISSNEAGTITSSLGFTSTTTGISGDNTITFNTLNAGTYTPTVTFTDASGNESTVALTSFVIDDTAPTLIEDTVVSTPSNDTTPSVVISSNEAGTITSSLGFTSTTTGISGDNTITFNTLNAGTYTPTVTFTDASGNESTVALTSFVIDDTAPTLIEDTVVSTPSNDTTPSVVISSNEAGTITSSLGFTSTTTGISGDNTITFNTLNAGTYTPTVTFTDASGNESTVALTSFVIDDTAPTLIEDTVVSTPSNDTTPSVVISSNEAGTITSSLGFTSTTTGISGDNTITFNTLNAGTYTPTVTFTDASGNESTVALTSFVIDDTAPTLIEDTVVSTPSNDTTPSVVISSNEAGTITSSLGFTSTTTGISGDNTITFNTLNAGTYTPTVTFTDASGNESTVALTSFVIDDTAPTLIEDTVVSTPSNDTTPSVVISSNEAGTITSSLGFTSTTTGISGDNTITFNTLNAGTYTPTVTFTDASGNESTVALTSFVIDDTAPTLIEDTVVSTPSNDTTPSVVISSNEAGTITSSLGFTSTTTGISGDNTITFNTLNAGTYTPTVTFTDASGNESTVALTSFVIDDTAPTLIEDTVVSTPSNDTTPSVVISSNEAGTITSSLGFTSTTTGISGDNTITFNTLNAGTYTPTVTFTDASGNESTVALTSFVIDDTAPTLIEDTVVSTPSNDTTPSVVISSNEAGTITSSLGFTSTTTGISGDNTITFNTLNAGTYTPTVTFTDASGNESTVALTSFVIDDTAPTLIEDTVVSTPSNDTTPSVVISSNEAGTITSSLGFTSTTTGISGDNTITFNTLNAGTYTPTVTFTDASGNESTVALTSFVIDDTAPTLIEDTVVSTPSNDTTPSVVISSNEAGTITSSLGFTSTTTGISGDNTITFNTLNAGTYTPTVTFTDASGNESTVALTSFVIDDTAPTLIEDTVVSTPSNDTTPSVVISSNEAGTITSSLGFTSTTTGISGDNTITFNTLNAGTYTPTVTFTDASGNESTVALTSFVIDDTAPTLIEDTVVSTPSNDTTPSVVISSNEAGTITSSLGFTSTTTGISGDNTITFNTLNAGTYTPTVTFTDASGNESTVALTSFVIDDTAPVITTSSVESSIEEGDTALGSVSANETVTWSLGGTDVDYVSISSDGTLTLNSEADYETKISYSFTVTATDAVGNTTTISALVISVNDDGKVFICHVTGRGTNGKTLTKEVAPDAVDAHLNHGDSLGACDSDVDIISPEITSGATGIDLDENSGSGQTIYTIIANDDVAVTSYAIAGTDASLLSVNSSTGVVSLTADPDYETKNSYNFTVKASDAAGNTSDPTTVTFSINDLNENPPIISMLSGTDTVEMGGAWTDAGATSDGGEEVTTTGTVITTTVGTYTITYSATDAEENTGTATRTVTVVDTTAPIISVLSGTDTVEMGGAWTDAGATSDGGEEVTTTGTVITTTVGTYTITYSATDAEENTGTATRTVTVVDTTAPIISVLSGTDTVEMGGAWTDAGATSDGGEEVTTTGTVITTTVGTYTITYSATDAEENTGTATRTVTVVDTTAPIISVLSGTDTVEMGGAWTDAGATSDGGEEVTTTGTVITTTVGTYTITYSATDAEENTGTATRTVTVVDTTAPIISVLSGTDTVEMGGAWTDAGATSDGGEEVTTTGTVITTTVGTYTITYSATDAEENTGTATRTVTVVDTTAPIISVLSGTDTVEMGGAWTDAGATSDGGEEVTTTGTVITTTVGTYTITYSATDAEENTGTATRTVTVVDTTAPIISVLSGTDTVEMGGAWTDAGATSDGGEEVTTTGTVITTTVGTYTITYSATDAEENTGTATRTVTVVDTTAPIISVLSGTDTVEMGGAWTDAGATSDGGEEVTTTGTVITTTVGTYTITYSATDAEENTGTATRTVTVVDTTAPIISVLSGTDTVEMGGAWTDAGATSDGGEEVTTTGTVITTTVGTYTITYSATDAEENTGTATRTVTVVDTTAPIISVLSGTDTVEMGGAWTDAGATSDGGEEVTTTGTVITTTVGTYTITYSATDAEENTGTATRTVTVVDTTAPIISVLSGTDTVEMGGAWTDAGATSDGGEEVTTTGTVITTTVGTYTITYSATDAEENTGTATRTVTVVDTTAPIISVLSGTDTVEMGGAWTDAGATSDGGEEVTTTGTVITTTVGTYTITYSATDAEENTGTATRTVTVVDTTAPIISVLSGTDTVEMGGAWTDAGATSDGGEEVTTTGTVITTTVGTYTITYSATDAEENTGTATRTVTVVDTTAPIISVLSGTDTVEMGGAWTDAGATSDGGEEVTTTGTVITTTVGTYTITYSATDAEENTGTATRTVTVVDTTAPIISVLSGTDTVEMGGAWTDAGATSDGGEEVTTTGTVITTTVGTYTITYSATDAEENTGTATRTVTVVDTTAPIISVLSGTDTVEMGGAWTDAGATSDGGEEVTTTGTVITTTVGTYTITYSATDAEENTGTATRTVTVVDTTAPIISVLSGTDTVEMGGAWTDAGATSDGGEEVTTTGTVITTTVGTYTITYSATDAEENTGTATRTVTVVDTTAPIISVLSGTDTVEMGGAWTDAGATSDGGEEVTTTGTVITTTVGTYTITYSATDAEENTGTATRTVTVVDTTAPIISVLSGTDTVEMGGAWTDAGATSDGGEEVTTTGTVITTTVGTYTITYSATDAEENTGTATRTVTVVDTTAPIISVLSGTDTVEMGGAWTDAGATSDGGEEVTTTGTVITTTVGTYTITYSATDAEENTGTATRTVTVVDTTAPIISVLSGTDTVEMGGAWTDAGATSDGGEEVTTTGTVITTTVGTYTITYSATDAEENTGTATRTVTVVDTTAPIISVLSGTDTVEMGGAWTDAGATSDGGEEVTTTGTVITTTVGTYTITYSATDAEENTGTATRTVTVVDTTAPIISVLSGTDTVEMGGAWTDAGATSDGGEEVTTTGTVITTTVGTYTITYSATDAEENTGTATRTVTVVDTTAPIISMLSGTDTVEMGGAWTDAGATSDGGEEVTTTGTVITTTVGTYTITYSATDAEENTGTATRT
ncbi:beta strand repeat-containing protein, partial [uncultured Polaribacter sp.]|uniref:beta strand repeat-containing protein n=1 Tax=uncultured Polaribacter sp. TaxID=174711 RepID=UPI0037038B53